MNNLILVFTWLIVTTCLNVTPVHAENSPLPDSLLTDDYVYEYTFSDFDKATQIMKELRKRNTKCCIVTYVLLALKRSTTHLKSEY